VRSLPRIGYIEELLSGLELGDMGVGNEANRKSPQRHAYSSFEVPEHADDPVRGSAGHPGVHGQLTAAS
jgi:hypothetical protein